MKQESKLLLSLLHGAGVGAIIVSGGSLISTDAVAGISATKHNLGGATTGNRVTGGATGEICVFCHTPHGADTSQPIPLWNKSIPATTYTTYAQLGTSTLDAANNNGTIATGSISVACLSCHDGTQAMDNMLNTPGSGTVANGAVGVGQTGATWNWATGAGTTTNIEGLLNAGAITNIGADLRNDHPIGVAYCGGNTGAYVTNTTTGCRDGDFKAIQFTGAGATAQYWVDSPGGTANSRDKSDMILYTRDFGGTPKPSVECGSCHDPHVETKVTNQTAFLRVSQANSGLCLSCHNK